MTENPMKKSKDIVKKFDVIIKDEEGTTHWETFQIAYFGDDNKIPTDMFKKTVGKISNNAIKKFLTKPKPKKQ